MSRKEFILRVAFEPNRLAQESLTIAYELVLPVKRRIVRKAEEASLTSQPPAQANRKQP